ncbi:MAG: hypothetical protein AAFR27_03970 [Pseudomonadota bacterium]
MADSFSQMIGTLYIGTAKNNVPITVDLTDRAVDAISATKTGDMWFMIQSEGAPFKSKESFGNWFGARCREVGLEKGKSAHGVRKLTATLAADGRTTTHALMAHFGRQTVRQTSSTMPKAMSMSASLTQSSARGGELHHAKVASA